MHKDAQKKAPHSPAAQRPSDLLHFLLRYLLNQPVLSPTAMPARFALSAVSPTRRLSSCSRIVLRFVDGAAAPLPASATLAALATLAG
jgi:hypothetical protein